MRITYTAPNRAHHFPYAIALHQAGMLHAFVSGVSRWNPQGGLLEIGERLHRADHLQNIYLASLRLRAPQWTSDRLAYLAKLWLDRCSESPARKSDLFFFYNGTGLRTMRRLKGTSVRCVVEVVNSHVLFQENLLRDEHRLLKLPFIPFPSHEVARRLAEYEEAEAVVCPSRFVAKSFVQHGIPPEKLHLVPYGFPFPKTEYSGAVERKESFRILYVGQISVRKGIRYVVEAFRKIRHPHKELVLVGPVVQPNGLENIKIPEAVTFTGVLKGAALEAQYRAADVFVLPSIEDGMGLVMGEALAYGVPVVASENTGAHTLFTNGIEGFIVPVRSSICIADRIQRLIDDAELCQNMRSAALLKSQQIGGWDTNARVLTSCLSSLASGVVSKTNDTISCESN